MEVSINTIWHTVKESDEVLNEVIQSYLECSYFLGDPATTVAQWRVENYSELRRLSYPSLGNLADTQVKLNSVIEEEVTQGQLEMNEYRDRCLYIKMRFPKE